MIDLFSTLQIREIENQSPEPAELMSRAGAAAAQQATLMLAHYHAIHGPGGHILVLAGPGNNGGDGWVAAQALQGQHHVTVLSPFKACCAPAAQAAYAAYIAAGGRVIDSWPDGETYNLIIDALLGTGFLRPIDSVLAGLISKANQTRLENATAILALDIPTGLNADTGAVMGTAMLADETLTFIAAKPGLYTGDGPDYAGKITIARLGLTPHSKNGLLEVADIASTLPVRKYSSHKGHFGALGVIGGAAGMVGAALLSARAALHTGAGRVYLGTIAVNALSVDLLQPEIMLQRCDTLLLLDTLTALALGPGMGNGDTAQRLLEQALSSPLPLVLDADALNLLANHEALAQRLRNRPITQPCLLTPHPGEAARLLHCSTDEIQQNRVASACKLAALYQSHVILKGVGSICATPEGTYTINQTGNPGMASAGMGDVLTGIAGALLAQGLPMVAAMHAAVYLHGAAADICVASGDGPIGLTASDVIRQLPYTINSLAR